MNRFTAAKDATLERVRAWRPKEVDAFPYTEPAATVVSNKGGSLSLFAYILLLWAGYEAVQGLSKGEFTTSYNAQPIGSNEGKTLKLPTQIAIIIKNGFAPMYDSSLVTVSAAARVIHESDTNSDKPREKYPLDVTDCTIGEGEFTTPAQAKCITFNKDHWGVKGSYDEDIYKYVEISVDPCIDSAHDIQQDAENDDLPNRFNRKCAPKQNITNMFFSNNARANVALWVRQQDDFNSYRWKSKAYVSISEKWMGVETYFRNVDLLRYGTLSLETGRDSYRELSDTSIRESPIKVDNLGQYGNMLRYYLRADDEEVTITLTKYGFVQAMELIGSAWSCLTLTIGALAMYFNSKKYSTAVKVYNEELKADQKRRWDEFDNIKSSAKELGERMSEIEQGATLEDKKVADLEAGQADLERGQAELEAGQAKLRAQQLRQPEISSPRTLKRQVSLSINDKLQDFERRISLQDIERRLFDRLEGTEKHLGAKLATALKKITDTWGTFKTFDES